MLSGVGGRVDVGFKVRLFLPTAIRLSGIRVRDIRLCHARMHAVDGQSQIDMPQSVWDENAERESVTALWAAIWSGCPLSWVSR